MTKEYWESTEWILAVFPCNLAAGSYYELVSYDQSVWRTVIGEHLCLNDQAVLS